MVTCLLHIPVCFKKWKKELEFLEYNLKRFKQPNFNSGSDHKVSIIVSVNGRGYDSKFVELRDEYKFESFIRQNIGYQWGGFYDSFKMNEGTYNWYATLEVDQCLDEHWLDKCLLKADNGYVGQAPLKIFHNIRYPENWEWSKNKQHTNGGFDFCSLGLLKQIDYEYGCFTDSTGDDLIIDGILHGEIGFNIKVSRFTKLQIILIIKAIKL